MERVAPWRLTSLGVLVRDASSIKPSSVTRFMSSQSLEKSQFQLINCIVRAAPGNPIKANPFLASSEVSKCSPMHVDWQTMEIRPVGAILWSLLRKFPFVSLPRPTHLRTPPTLYCFTNQLVTGQWRPQSYFFCCFGVHDLRNSWRFKEASPPQRAVLSQSRLDHPCILFPIPHSFIY